MSGSMPTDPFSAMGDAATSLHEFYESLKAGGFTEAEAFRLIGEMLAAQGRQA